MITKDIVRQNITTWPELGINYWGINKNATSTLINHFNILCNNISVDKINLSGGQHGKSISKSRFIDKNTAINNNLINFAVVRNPHNRFISCYKQFKFPITAEQERSSKKARFNPNWSANNFLLHIQKCLNKNPKSGNKHFWAQSTFLHSPEKIDYIIKLEALTESWPFDFCPPTFKSNVSNQNITNLIYDEECLYNIYIEDFKKFDY